jgi:hypothetical protein
MTALRCKTLKRMEFSPRTVDKVMIPASLEVKSARIKIVMHKAKVKSRDSFAGAIPSLKF